MIPSLAAFGYPQFGVTGFPAVIKKGLALFGVSF
jgi:hypothetical protein